MRIVPIFNSFDINRTNKSIPTLMKTNGRGGGGVICPYKGAFLYILCMMAAKKIRFIMIVN